MPGSPQTCRQKTCIAEERRLALNKQRVIEVMNAPATKDRPKPVPRVKSGKLRIEDLLPSVGFSKTLAVVHHRRDLMADGVVQADCGITREEAGSWLWLAPPECERMFGFSYPPDLAVIFVGLFDRQTTGA